MSKHTSILGGGHPSIGGRAAGFGWGAGEVRGNSAFGTERFERKRDGMNLKKFGHSLGLALLMCTSSAAMVACGGDDNGTDTGNNNNNDGENESGGQLASKRTFRIPCYFVFKNKIKYETKKNRNEKI